MMRNIEVRAFFNGILCGVAFLLPALGATQPATPAQRAGVTPKPDYGTLHLQANIGSFRMIDGVGRVEISFTGSVLISGDPKKLKIETQGNLRQEHMDDRRQTWFGTGRIVVTGSFRAIQWFGRDMRTVWYGRGIVRLTAEFDRNLKTGTFWYDNPEAKSEWFSQGITTITNPMKPATPPGGTVPRERTGGG
ncbi:MAG TPA: hypothetical protein PKY51_01295 [Fimbriimonadaceae bacterium]|nr:hypothetical protein [Fimbriimonadaceae bacterium]